MFPNERRVAAFSGPGTVAWEGSFSHEKNAFSPRATVEQKTTYPPPAPHYGAAGGMKLIAIVIFITWLIEWTPAAPPEAYRVKKSGAGIILPPEAYRSQQKRQGGAKPLEKMVIAIDWLKENGYKKVRALSVRKNKVQLHAARKFMHIWKIHITNMITILASQKCPDSSFIIFPPCFNIYDKILKPHWQIYPLYNSRA